MTTLTMFTTELERLRHTPTIVERYHRGEHLADYLTEADCHGLATILLEHPAVRGEERCRVMLAESVAHHTDPAWLADTFADAGIDSPDSPVVAYQVEELPWHMLLRGLAEAPDHVWHGLVEQLPAEVRAEVEEGLAISAGHNLDAVIEDRGPYVCGVTGEPGVGPALYLSLRGYLRDANEDTDFTIGTEALRDLLDV